MWSHIPITYFQLSLSGADVRKGISRNWDKQNSSDINIIACGIPQFCSTLGHFEVCNFYILELSQWAAIDGQ